MEKWGNKDGGKFPWDLLSKKSSCLHVLLDDQSDRQRGEGQVANRKGTWRLNRAPTWSTRCRAAEQAWERK